MRYQILLQKHVRVYMLQQNVFVKSRIPNKLFCDQDPSSLAELFQNHCFYFK